MFTSATQPPPWPRPPLPPPRHNFVVSAITFEGFKLRSSNLTHALFIQISRTSSITDIVVQSKMAAGGHFVTPSHNFIVSAITFEGFKLRSSNLTHALFIQISRTSSITDIVIQSKMAAGGHFVKKIPKKKSCVSFWNGKNCDRKLFSDIQNGRRRPLFTTFSHLPHFFKLFPTFRHF